MPYLGVFGQQLAIAMFEIPLLGFVKFQSFTQDKKNFKLGFKNAF